MSKSRKRILIIDDDEAMCEELGEILKGEGFLVDSVYNGYDAKNILQQDIHDLVLLDMKLPGILGTEIIKTAKEMGSGAKILVMSGSDFVTRFKEDKQAAVEEGTEKLLWLADGVISKPFQVEDILNKVRELLQ
ncbi:MAG: response regulator [Candidatus Omnitrophota bacterium]